MAKINPMIFRGFSIRGIVGDDFDLESMIMIGRGVGKWFAQHIGNKVVVGYDVRNSSPELHSSLCKGLLSTGVNVIDIGLTPTPILNFATDFYKASGGVMVTASHNPSQYNGLKIRSNRTIYGDDFKDIYTLSLEEGSVVQKGDYEKRDPFKVYASELIKRAKIGKPMRVVVDGGNGANGQVVPKILRDLGFEVFELFCDLNGAFPNRDPDPTAFEATAPLARKVLETKADIGLAFDGDGDRVIAVDDTGQTIFGDQLLMVLAGDLISTKVADKVVYDVLCSQVVPDYIAEMGAQPFPAPSGYAFVHNVMLLTGAQVGGEMSGHMFLLDDTFKFDDAILAAIKLLSILSLQKNALSEVISELPKYFASREYRLPCPDEIKNSVVDSIRKFYSHSGYQLDEIDGVRVNFGGTWALVRQSNTQPIISLRFESKASFEEMQKVKLSFAKKLGEVYHENNLTFPGLED